MFNKPRRPYYNWSNVDSEHTIYNQTTGHSVIESKRFWQLWKNLRRRQAAAQKQHKKAAAANK